MRGTVGYRLTRDLRAAGSPCHAPTKPAIVPRIRSRSNVPVPDVTVTCASIDAGQLALPDPLLIVEILSPSNESDTCEKVWTYVSISHTAHEAPARSTVASSSMFATVRCSDRIRSGTG
jgi:Uma2 family endonuclease